MLISRAYAEVIPENTRIEMYTVGVKSYQPKPQKTSQTANSFPLCKTANTC